MTCKLATFYLAYLLVFKRTLNVLASVENIARIGFGLDHLATLVGSTQFVVSDAGAANREIAFPHTRSKGTLDGTKTQAFSTSWTMTDPEKGLPTLCPLF